MEYLLHSVASLEWFNSESVILAAGFLAVCGLASKSSH